TLTPLPDQTGFAGVVSFQPAELFSIDASFGMRRATACLVCTLEPSMARRGDEFSTLYFYGVTVAKL
ncbi:MAG: hypothetical protein ACP5R5_11385, partial [Armatimonadota bacterium]